MFEQIAAKLQEVAKKLRDQPRLKAQHVDTALKDLRLALLEADVNFIVAKQFCARVREKAVGKEILDSLTASQQVIKVVRDEMVELLGSTERLLDLRDRLPAVILVAGLSGSGKTTTSVKLAHYLLKEEGRRPALVSVDVKRPAALEQLLVLGGQVGIQVLEPETMEAVDRAGQAVRMASDSGYDVLVVDTAGRIHLDDELMQELRKIVDITQPSEVLYIADAMTGQDAVQSAKGFGQVVTLSGHVLTKLDGDARGGAALSIVEVTGKPIKFAGIGEKLTELERFRPERMASRILGMGDVLTLIERVEGKVNREQAADLAQKLTRDQLTLEDFRGQLQQMRRMGSLSELLSFLPGGNQLPAEIDDSELSRFESILNSMTVYERQNPQVMNGSRRRRIAKGSGCVVSDVNRLLRRFAEARKMMKKILKVQRSRGGMGRQIALR